MKPAPFDYVRPTGVTEAIEHLRREEGAKVIAGGQSLVPLMAMRLARPTLLVDVNDLHLDTVEVASVGANEGGCLRIGATTRHARLEVDPLIRRVAPLLAEAAGLVGHPAIRARGTIGGSLAHADPLAELPAALVATLGSVIARGPFGDRTIPAAELFTGFLSTTLAPDELLVEVSIPVAGAHHGSSFCEWAPRAGDFAVAGVAVVVERPPGLECISARGATIGVGSVPVDCTDALGAAVGATAPDDLLLRHVARQVRDLVRGDEDRAGLIGKLAVRALRRAFARSSNAAGVAA